MRVIMETPHLVVTVDPATAIVRYVRTAKPYETASEMLREHVQLAAELDRLRRRDHVLLADLREGPLNASPAFELAMIESRKHLSRGFPRMAVLVRSAIGALQITRQVREDGLEVPVVRDEQEALRHLLRASERPPAGRKANRS